MRGLDTTRLSDPVADKVNRSNQDAIRELQAQPAVDARIFTVSLPDNKETVVAHGLGREPKIAITGIVRGAASGGLIRDFGSKSPLTGLVIDRSKVLLLRTDGWGATITVDIEVK